MLALEGLGRGDCGMRAALPALRSSAIKLRGEGGELQRTIKSRRGPYDCGMHTACVHEAPCHQCNGQINGPSGETLLLQKAVESDQRDCDCKLTWVEIFGIKKSNHKDCAKIINHSQ